MLLRRTVVVVVSLLALTAVLPTTAAAKAKRVIYTQSGQRSSTTPAFTVPENWTVVWSYDCKKSMFSEGSFVLSVHRVSGNSVAAEPEGDQIDVSGAQGAGRQAFHGAGRKTIVVVAQCPWRIKVVRGGT